MARAFNKKTSIYFQLFRLMIIAAVAAVIVFFLLDYNVSDMIENNYYRSDFEDIRNKEYIEELQQYIDRHQLISRDSAELSDWVKQPEDCSSFVFIKIIFRYLIQNIRKRNYGSMK